MDRLDRFNTSRAGQGSGDAYGNHDALDAMCRDLLASGELGQHHGLPVSIVVSTSLQELESAAGKAMTGGGSWLPIPDLIRLAGHAHHCWKVFDKHSGQELYLAHAKRLASPSQRLVLHAKDRGCTKPGCTVPGYLCQAHHVDEVANGGPTNIDNLTFACKPHHRVLDHHGWKTRKRVDGTTEWIPPRQDFPALPRDYPHPQRYSDP